jgi:hypothetical protein
MNEVLKITTRDIVNLFEAEMLKQPQLNLTVKHHFSPGVYARELFIPAGTLLTGKIHRFEHLNIMSQGDMSVLTEDGVKRVQAPFTIVSPAGTKRIAFAHSDTVWTTIHATDETDIERIENLLVADSEADYSKFILMARENNKCLS